MSVTPGTVQPPVPVAYSYVRFSTAKQELGDSLRRQVESAEDYCREHGLQLAPVSYRDLGVSAFKRRNFEKGALAAFIGAVKNGKVAEGSFLIVEQFDRLSRAYTNVALRLLMDIVEAGINVVTLVDRKIWDRESIKDASNLMLAVMYMARANNESEAKALRLSTVWKQKKLRAADGTAPRIVTSECPRWLRANAGKTGFEILQDRVESIRKVFDMRINGFGIVAIVKRANQERWPAPGKMSVRKQGESADDFERRKTAGATWHTSTVGRLLKNRALLGEYQPRSLHPTDEAKRVTFGEPIKNYYPAVLDESTFLRAQATVERRGRFPGRRDVNMRNWLQGLVQCSCGHSLVRKNKQSKSQPGYARYYCTARVRGASKCPGVSAKELEESVLYVVSFYFPSRFGSASLDELKVRIELLESQVVTTKRAQERYAEAIGMADELVTLVEKLKTATTTLHEYERQLSVARAELADASFDDEVVLKKLADMAYAHDNPNEYAALREELARALDKIVVHQDEGFIRVFAKGLAYTFVHILRPDGVLPDLTAAERPPERLTA
ncbi:recombinase family protein [Paraburkholderia sp. BL25I1N1]|uniref:recombinase family protein n=1 Tax=Paraburkholderia sp. BL25I1N1 TaxID=1938804 RepID=UPI000D0536D1|nr:recombinase family protein [Paraburkholderia sp. BL25I1N1]PRY05595.1 DNA invertase Pin-like site-specific DNA recombinase [Paraburkholderia sp. BL25I1N1]